MSGWDKYLPSCLEFCPLSLVSNDWQTRDPAREGPPELNFSTCISSLHKAFHDQCIGPVDQKLIEMVEKPPSRPWLS